MIYKKNKSTKDFEIIVIINNSSNAMVLAVRLLKKLGFSGALDIVICIHEMCVLSQ